MREDLRSGPLVRVYEPAYAHEATPLPEGYVAPSGQRAIKLHEIDFYVTMNCNQRCTFCSVRAGEYDHAEMPLGRWLEIIDEAGALGLEELHFLGGEPTLRGDLEDMIGHASRKGISTRVITNGILLDPTRIKGMIDCGLQELMFSIDGMPERHNALRFAGTKAWHRTMRALDHAVALGIRTRMAITAYHDNYDDVVPLLRLAADRKVDEFSVFLGSPLGRGREMKSSVIDPTSWRRLQEDVCAELERLHSPMDVIMEQGFAWHDGPTVDRSQIKGRGTGCNTLLDDYNYLIVRSDGNLYQCVFFVTEGKPIGNVWESPLKESLEFALEKAEYRPFTQANDKCTSCLHQAECGTGCRGYAQLLKGDWLKTDPRCAKNAPGDREAPDYFPLCPILKWNALTGAFGGSSEDALRD